MVGPKSIRYHAPLDRLPLFVKADSIIPMGPEMSYVGEKPFDPITLDIYLYDRAKFTMYDDEQVLFKGERGPKAITFEISNSTKSYILRFNNTPCPARVRVNKKDLNRFLTRDVQHVCGEKTRSSIGKTETSISVPKLNGGDEHERGGIMRSEKILEPPPDIPHVLRRVLWARGTRQRFLPLSGGGDREMSKFTSAGKNLFCRPLLSISARLRSHPRRGTGGHSFTGVPFCLGIGRVSTAARSPRTSGQFPPRDGFA